MDSRSSDVGMVRMVASVTAVIGAVWLAAASPPWWAWFGVVGGLFFAWFWFRRWVQSRASADDPESSYLGLERDAMHVALGGQLEVIEWDRVARIEADEERVAIRVELLDDTTPRYVQPTYGGLGLYELERAIQRAHRAADATG